MTGKPWTSTRSSCRALRRGAAVVTFAAPACQDLASARIVGSGRFLLSH